MRRVLWTALVCAACNQTPIETPVRSFDRPSDAALSCTILNPNPDGATQPDSQGNFFSRWEPLPLSACAPVPVDQLITYKNPLSPDDPTTDYVPELRVLVTNSARGEVALVNVPRQILIDLDEQNPGFNFVPVGRLPETIRASNDGCMAVTANVDSCDLAMINLTTLYNMPFCANFPAPHAQLRDDCTHDVVNNIQIYADTGDAKGAGARRLEARPTAIEFAPSPTSDAQANLTCANRAEHAWVALPGCQAVVEVSLSLSSSADMSIHAVVERAILVTRDGATVLPSVTANGITTLADPSQLSCPVECTEALGDLGLVGSTDPLATTDGGARLPTGQAAPGTLAVDTESGTQRLVIGDSYGETVSLFTLDPATGDPTLSKAIALEAGAIGVTRVRVSPRTPAGKFLYAIARDGTARVIDLDRQVECETNPEPIALEGVPPIDPLTDARRLGCFPLGDPATPRRSGDAIGPGIALPNGALARDVAFVHLDTPPPPASGPPASAQPQLLVGDFAWLTGSDGHSTVVNIFDACPQPNDPQLQSDGSYFPACENINIVQSRYNDYNFNIGNPLPLDLERVSHRLREGTRRFLPPANPGDSVGTPRLQDPSLGNTVTITVNGSPANAEAGFTLPSLESVTRGFPELLRQPAPPAPPITGYPVVLDFPDPMRAAAETWTLEWEGVLPATLRTLGRVCGVGDASCPRGSLIDAGATFCGRDVEVGDKLELLGCDTDADCTYTQLCAHDPTAPPLVTSGLCLDLATVDQQITRCSDILRAQRRYRITAPRQGVTLASGDVTDVLELAEIYEPEYASQTVECNIDDDCMGVVTIPPPVTAIGVAPLATSCLLDSDGLHRCLRSCDPASAEPSKALCGTGYLCGTSNMSTATNPDHRCMRAPLDIGLFSECFKQPQRYEVRAGEAFTVTGSSSGYISDYEPNPITKVCEPVPESIERVRLRRARIPLEAPDCPLVPDALSWVGPDAPNACRYITGAPRTPNVDGCNPPCRDREICMPDHTCQPPARVLETVDRVLHFENPVLTFALHMPHNPTGYVPDDFTVISFFVVGGGFPLGLQLGVPTNTPALAPRSSVVSPDGQTVFVVDEGKTLDPTGLRGQLLRLVSALQICDPAFQIR